MGYELDESKTKYFVIAIILLIILGVVLVVHFNNKSLVSGEEEKETTTTIKDVDTTEEYEYKNDEEKVIKVNKNTNTDKEEVSVEITENTIYKSTIDKNTNMVFNYKLTDEITDNDKIVSTQLTIVDSLKNNNVVSLYDISLYDSNDVKKSVNNSLITISIPLGDLVGYDTYKVVYIDDNNVISDEVIDSKVEDGYIKFDVKHLSKYGIIATKTIVEEEKEEIDLTKVSLDVKINEELVNDTNMYVSTTDKVSVVVNGIEIDYKLYYLLQNEESTNSYVEFKEDLFSSIETPSKYKLSIKLEVDGEIKVFEIGTVNVFDIVFVYDKNEEITEDVILGTIVDENGVESTYKDKETNKDIVIDNVEKEEVIIEENINEDNEIKEEILIDDVEEPDETSSEEEKEENLDDKATIKLNGNIYLVEKTDISELEMTGHLVIETSEDITFAYENDKLLTSNLYTITIKSKEFSLNGVKYTYEFVNGDIVIKRLEEEQEVVVEDFSNIFNDYQINNKPENEELILEKQIITN